MEKPDSELKDEPVPVPAAEPEKKKKTNTKKGDKNGKYTKPKFPLPWTGDVVESWCQALRPNAGMLSQCTQAQKTNGLCGTCFNQQQILGKPKCGSVKDRIEADTSGITYKNPETGKEPIRFGIYMAKQGISREDADAEAAKFGITIPESEYVVPTKRKGRPPKAPPSTKGEDSLSQIITNALATTVSSSSESEEEKETDKKSNTVESVKNNEEVSVYDAETDVDEPDSPATQVVKFTHNNTEYLRDPDTEILYDPVTHNAVGVWDEETQTIKQCELFSEDEESDNE